MNDGYKTETLRVDHYHVTDEYGNIIAVNGQTAFTENDLKTVKEIARTEMDFCDDESCITSETWSPQ